MRAPLWLTVVTGVACSSGGTIDAGFDAGPMPSCDDIFGDAKTQACLRWSCDRRDLREGASSADAGACVPGDLEVEGRENALKVLNLYRHFAGLPAVTTLVMRDQAAQACALMMHAANALDNRPMNTWPCWSAMGAQAAGNSVLALAPAVAAVDRHLEGGAPATLENRRWLLATTLGPIGIGGTSGASCVWVSGGSSSTARRFVAWPPAGTVPLAALQTPRVDVAGWSVHTFAAADDLTGATVAVRDDGVDAPVDVTLLERDFGSRYAVAFRPRGWTTQAGHEYLVNVVAPAISQNPIVYTVKVVGCP